MSMKQATSKETIYFLYNMCPDGLLAKSMLANTRDQSRNQTRLLICICLLWQTRRSVCLSRAYSEAAWPGHEAKSRREDIADKLMVADYVCRSLFPHVQSLSTNTSIPTKYQPASPSIDCSHMSRASSLPKATSSQVVAGHYQNSVVV